MNALKKGFQDILPLDSIKMFDEKEVEVRIAPPRPDREKSLREVSAVLALDQWSRRDQRQRLANLHHVQRRLHARQSRHTVVLEGTTHFTGSSLKRCTVEFEWPPLTVLLLL